MPMTLTMQGSTGRAEKLPFLEFEICTGMMGDCVCAIVMFGHAPQGVFTQVRGFHGAGGIGNVNWQSLYQPVNAIAPVANKTIVTFILCGPNNSQHNASLELAMYDARRNSPLRTEFVIVHGLSSATLDRYGRLVDWIGKPQYMTVFGRHQFVTNLRNSPNPPPPGQSGHAKTWGGPSWFND